LDGDGIGLRPLGEIVHRDHEVSVPLVAMREGSAMSMAILSNGAPTLYLLIHQASTLGSLAATGFFGVAVLVLLLDVVSCLEPVIPLPDLVHGLADTQVSS
jgi:hypothetical protein